MKNFIKTFSILSSIIIATLSTVSAAHMYIDSPKGASSNRTPLSLSVILDGEGDNVSGLSGNLSFPADLFDVKIISTQNSIVPLWAVEPHVSTDKTFDQRTHIIFEGIIPGGFSGVHNPYYQGVYPGIVYTITLIPKSSGSDNFTLNDVELHAYDSEGTIISTKGDIKPITVPALTGKYVKQIPDLIPTAESNTISMNIARSELINNGASYLYVHDENSSHAIDHIEVAESDEYNPNYVSSYEWHTVSNPYMLIYTARTKYIHAKVVYTDNTYAMKTLPPVENSQAFLHSSRILLYILIAIAMLYFYGKNFLHILSRSSTKHR